MDQPQVATGAGIPLLATKLHIPAWRPGFVSRPRLIAALERGAGSKLTLVSAPAGFGKSTLLAEWHATSRSGPRVGWVSLDRGDNDPALFWTYAIAALQIRCPGVGDRSLALLRSLQSLPIESVLAGLINDLSAMSDPLVLILDDLHAIDSRPIHEGIAFLIDHLPPHLRLIVSTRADPPLPLARLRGRGELVELRAADLRFTEQEAAAFLNDAMGLHLADDDVRALESRAEGWIAGLQLAALSMRDQQDVHGFIQSFAGDHRYIVDYLLEEVLMRQPEGVRRFLLQTSLLDRMCGSLCDAVTGDSDGTAQLTTLERGNFFLIPLDDTRTWYRYHHLFADVLRARLLEEHPEQVAELHLRASGWFAQHGAPADAIQHALAAGDFARAADLVELAATRMRQNRQEATLLEWLQAIPDEEIRRRPMLSAVYAGVLLSGGMLQGFAERMQDAEQWLDLMDADPDAAPEGMVVADHAGFGRLRGTLAVYRSGAALAQGNVGETVDNARRALELVAEEDLLSRGATAAILGLAYWTNGELEPAYRSYAEGMERLRQAGYFVDAIGGASTLADIRIAQGRLHDAARIYDGGLQLAREQGIPPPRGTADLFVGMGEIALERNDLDSALSNLRTSEELGEIAGFPQHPYRRRVLRARIQIAQGDLDGAIEMLDEAERRYLSDFHPDVRPIGALRARVRISQGRVDEALAWARAQGLSIDDDLSYLHAYSHMTLARALLAQGIGERSDRALHQAAELLERLREDAEAGERTGHLIEILMLQSLVQQARGDLAAALPPLQRALALAEPEGWSRVFLAEGDPIRRLLRQAAGGEEGGSARRLLHAWERPAQAQTGASSARALTEPLTPREIEILRLIAAGLRNQEIADQLFISLPTVKRHVANAYGKLDATHRTEAIARAQALNLL